MNRSVFVAALAALVLAACGGQPAPAPPAQAPAAPEHAGHDHAQMAFHPHHGGVAAAAGDYNAEIIFAGDRLDALFFRADGASIPAAEIPTGTLQILLADGARQTAPLSAQGADRLSTGKLPAGILPPFDGVVQVAIAGETLGFRFRIESVAAAPGPDHAGDHPHGPGTHTH